MKQITLEEMKHALLKNHEEGLKMSLHSLRVLSIYIWSIYTIDGFAGINLLLVVFFLAAMSGVAFFSKKLNRES